jgi:tRNA-Thr(GGU) m(6)t(6)A37 methyltransferase TsaA
MEFIFRQIGVIHSPFTDKTSTPIQPTRSEAVGIVEVFPQYTQGLQDIDEITHLILLYVFHKSEGYRLLVKPYLDDQYHGLFATRYQERPNPIGLSIVRLLHREDNKLMIKGVDVLDGTPLIDIKPYIPDFDLREGDPSGWYDNRSIRD